MQAIRVPRVFTSSAPNSMETVWKQYGNSIEAASRCCSDTVCMLVGKGDGEMVGEHFRRPHGTGAARVDRSSKNKPENTDPNPAPNAPEKTPPSAPENSNL